MISKEIGAQLTRGGAICMATDTVYGLVCLASSPEAVKRLYEVKGREGKPGTIIAASVAQLVGLGFDADDLAKAQIHWPGPISIVLPAPEKLLYLHMGLESLAVRIPADIELRSLLEQTGPLATTSANRPGEPVVTNIESAKAIFGDKVALYINGGEINNPPSTILELTINGFTKIR
jgi:L-threonylcarbamoyladenylate synthase